jgi:hypothetical protein
VDQGQPLIIDSAEKHSARNALKAWRPPFPAEVLGAMSARDTRL